MFKNIRSIQRTTTIPVKTGQFQLAALSSLLQLWAPSSGMDAVSALVFIRTTVLGCSLRAACVLMSVGRARWARKLPLYLSYVCVTCQRFPTHSQLPPRTWSLLISVSLHPKIFNSSDSGAANGSYSRTYCIQCILQPLTSTCGRWCMCVNEMASNRMKRMAWV